MRASREGAGFDPTERFFLSLLAGEPDVPEGVDWVRAGRYLVRSRLAPLAGASHRARQGQLLPPRVARRVESAYRRTGLRNTLQGELLAPVLETLRREGVPVLLFKGAALLRTGTYPDPGARPMDDVDLLVPRAHAGEAVDLLVEQGFRPWMPWTPQHPGWLDSLTLSGPEGPGGSFLVIDLHWRTEFGHPRYGRSPPNDPPPDAASDPRPSNGEPEALVSDSPLWRRADLQAGLPATEPHLVILAEHFLKHLGYRTHFPGLADVARLLPRVESWDQVLAAARHRELAPGVGLLFRVLDEEAGIPVPRNVIRSLGGDRLWVRMVESRLRPAGLLERDLPVGTRVGGLAFRACLLGSPGRAMKVGADTLLPEERWLRSRYEDHETGRLALQARYLAAVVRWCLGRGHSPVSPNQPDTVSRG